MIRPVNWVLDRFFRGFNWVFDWTTACYGKSRGLVPPPQRDRAPGLRRPDRLDGLRLRTRSRRLRPHPGQGLSDGEHPTARLRLAGAHGRGDRRGRKDRPGDARRGPHGGHSGHVVRPERQQLELRLHVRHPQAVPRTARPGADRRGHRRPAPRTLSTRGPRGPRAGLRAAGGARASATPAASS